MKCELPRGLEEPPGQLRWKGRVALEQGGRCSRVGSSQVLTRTQQHTKADLPEPRVPWLLGLSHFLELSSDCTRSLSQGFPAPSVSLMLLED